MKRRHFVWTAAMGALTAWKVHALGGAMLAEPVTAGALADPAPFITGTISFEKGEMRRLMGGGMSAADVVDVKIESLRGALLSYIHDEAGL